MPIVEGSNIVKNYVARKEEIMECRSFLPRSFDPILESYLSGMKLKGNTLEKIELEFIKKVRVFLEVYAAVYENDPYIKGIIITSLYEVEEMMLPSSLESLKWYQEILRKITEDVHSRDIDSGINENIEGILETIITEGSNPAQIVNGIVSFLEIRPWWGVMDSDLQEEIKKDWRQTVCEHFSGKVQ
ncbi:MAG: hypothetical protein WCQ96_04810 [Patescibacteria group bacterium]